MEWDDPRTPSAIAAIVQYIINRSAEKDAPYCLDLQLIAGPHRKTSNAIEIKSTIKAVAYPYHEDSNYSATSADIVEVNDMGRALKKIIMDLQHLDPTLQISDQPHMPPHVIDRKPLPGFVNWEHL
jgi:hypothetical protein